MTDLLRTAQAAKRLGVSAETLRQYVAKGQVRAVRLPSGELRFRPADVDAALVPAFPEDGAA